jgi:hypothetical protein
MRQYPAIVVGSIPYVGERLHRHILDEHHYLPQVFLAENIHLFLVKSGPVTIILD